MQAQGSAGFIPWRDDAWLEAESAYALCNKVAWFLRLPPSRLLQRRTGEAQLRMDYYDVAAWGDRLLDAEWTPKVQGQPLRALLHRVSEQMAQEVPLAWRQRDLWVCPVCIATGVHLRLHQHAAVARCPRHAQPLTARCPHCRARLGFVSRVNRAPYACGQCRGSLLGQGQVGFHAGDRARQRWRTACEGAQAWLDHVHAALPLGAATTIAPRCGHRSIALELALQASVDLQACAPPWARRIGLDVDVAVRPRVPPSVSQGWRASGTGTRHIQVLSADGLALEPARRAVRIVAKEFLHAHGPRHPHCLDTPFRLVGEWREEVPHQGALLECCPVALGFWVWRLRWGHALVARLRAQTGPTACPAADESRQDATTARSHLQLCLAVAQAAVIRSSSASEAEQAIGRLRSLATMPPEDPRERASELDLAWGPSGAQRGPWTIDVRQRAQAPTQACPSTHPLPAALGRRRARSDSDWPDPDTWMQTPHAPGAAFIEMRNDWVFLRRAPGCVEVPDRRR